MTELNTTDTDRGEPRHDTLNGIDWGPERSRTVTWRDPERPAEVGLQMAGIDYLQAIIAGAIPPPPISGLVQMGIAEAEPGRVTFTCTPDERPCVASKRLVVSWNSAIESRL